jgi:hypothetical protein
MVKNEVGLVAVKHHNSNPSRTYQAHPNFNISLMWVKEEDVDRILNSPELKTKGCDCSGGVKKPLFYLANELDVSLHLTGDRPR